jgi:oligosaccharide repeat unit polymerase
MASDFTIVVLLLRIGDIEDCAASLMTGFIWGTVAVGVFAWILPSQSDLRLGDEEYLGPNQIGFACAFAFFFAQYLMRRGRKGLSIPAFFLAVTLLRSLSKTTIIAFMVAQLFLLMRDRSIPWKTKLYVSCGGGLVFAAFWSVLSAYYDIYTHAGNQSETLTGRIGIWAYILNEAVQQPWIGHGFHSVWKVIPPFGPFEARHAHNELLQQFYAYGIAGVVLLIGVYASIFREIRRAAPASIRTLLQALFLFIVIRGFADTEVFDLSLPLWGVALVGSLLADDAAQRTRMPARVSPAVRKSLICNVEAQRQ